MAVGEAVFVIRGRPRRRLVAKSEPWGVELGIPARGELIRRVGDVDGSPLSRIGQDRQVTEPIASLLQDDVMGEDLEPGERDVLTVRDELSERRVGGGVHGALDQPKPGPTSLIRMIHAPRRCSTSYSMLSRRGSTADQSPRGRSDGVARTSEVV